MHIVEFDDTGFVFVAVGVFMPQGLVSLVADVFM